MCPPSRPNPCRAVVQFGTRVQKQSSRVLKRPPENDIQPKLLPQHQRHRGLVIDRQFSVRPKVSCVGSTVAASQRRRTQLTQCCIQFPVNMLRNTGKGNAGSSANLVTPKVFTGALASFSLYRPHSHVLTLKKTRPIGHDLFREAISFQDSSQKKTVSFE